MVRGKGDKASCTGSPFHKKPLGGATMKDRALIGTGRRMIPIPGFLWRGEVSRKAKKQARKSVAFMTQEHHLVRDYVVIHLLDAEGPITPEQISKSTGLAPGKVLSILDQLEKRLVFLFRDDRGSVLWAYPVTADTTPHMVSLNSGESGCAA